VKSFEGKRLRDERYCLLSRCYRCEVSNAMMGQGLRMLAAN